MSLASLITNLTLVLQKHVDNNSIDELTMLNILSHTLNTFNSDSSSNITPLTFDNLKIDNITIKSINIPVLQHNISDNIDNKISYSTPTTSSSHNLTTKKSWCDIKDDDDDDNFSNNDNNDNNSTYSLHSLKDNNSTHSFQIIDNNKKISNNYHNKTHSTHINDITLQKFKKNCEKTITYFIHNYKIDHIDSAHNIQDLNLILTRLLGLNICSDHPQAYTNVCWFMRNTKCYYTDCLANTINMCTYAHPRNNKTLQFCCVDDDDYDIWPDNYYKCLKLDYNDNINKFIKKNGNKLLPLNKYKNIPQCIIDWYFYMVDILKHN